MVPVTHDDFVGSFDTTGDPFWTDDNYRQSDTIPDKIGFVEIPAMRAISERELKAASYTPFGRFIVDIISWLAFKDGWLYRDPKNIKKVVNKSTMEMLDVIDRQLDMKTMAISAIKQACRYGRSAWMKINIGREGQKVESIYRITRLPDEWIIFDNEPDPFTGITLPVDKQKGEPIAIRPMIHWGRGGMRQVIVPKEDFVIFLNGIDPDGNGWEGIPEIIAIYRAIKWDQNVLRSFAKVINQRGVGLLDVTIKGLRNEEEAKAWARKWGNPSQYAGLFHSDRITVETKEGIKPGYNIDTVAEVFRYYISAGTGTPGERMIGVQTSAVTGSKTDQDNMAEIYRTRHDTFDEYIEQMYTVIEPRLKNKFRLEFPINVRLDKETEAMIRQTNVTAFDTAQDYTKISVIESILDFEITDNDDEKNMFLAEWRDKQYPERKEMFEQQLSAQSGKPGGMQQSKKSDRTGPHGDDRTPKAGDQHRTVQQRDADYEILRQMSKEDVARMFARLGRVEGDYDEKLSVNDINDCLRRVFGSGMSNTAICEITREVEVNGR